MTPKALLFVAAAAVAVAWPVARPSAQAPAGAPITFTDVATAAGIRFTHVSGAFGTKYLPETMGRGAAFFDADNDGDQDVYFANGRSWPGQPAAGAPAFYRNNGTGGFVEETKAAGLSGAFYGIGTSAGLVIMRPLGPYARSAATTSASVSAATSSRRSASAPGSTGAS